MKTKPLATITLIALVLCTACSPAPANAPQTATREIVLSPTAGNQSPSALPEIPSTVPSEPAPSPTLPSPTPDTAVQAAAEATVQASSFLEIVDKLKDDGKITFSEGIYHRLADVDRTAALRGEYFWIPTDYSPKNFVLRAEVAWQSADMNADWSISGPGFLFHETGDARFYAIFLRLNGQVDLYRIDIDNDTFFFVASEKVWNTAKPSGEAVLMLAVEGDMLHFFVDDQPILDARDANLTSPAYGSGRLDLAIASGTNKDFGTRVIFSNVELWELGDPATLAASAPESIGLTPEQTSTPRPNDPFTEQGIQAFQSGDFGKAVELIGKALANPNYDNPDGYITRGRAYYALKQYSQAIADFTSAVRFAPAGAKIYLYRAYAYEKMKNNAKALADYNTAIQLDDGDVWPYRSRAMIYIAQKKYPEAMKDLDQAIQLADDSAATYNNRCWLKYLLKQYDEALPDCDKALGMEPDNASYLESRAFVFRALGQPDKALADFERILTLSEDKTVTNRIQAEMKKLQSP